MAWKVRTIMSQRHEFCLLALEPGSNLSALCKQFSISRTTGHKWLNRYREEGDLGLYDQSRRPHHSPGLVDPQVEAIVVDLRHEYEFWGPRKLHRLLRDQLSPDLMPSRATVARILKRNGLIKTQEPKTNWPAVGRFERPFPNDLWQMDLKSYILLPNGHKIYPVAVLDDHSRYLLRLKVILDQTDDSVINCWIEAAMKHGFPNDTLTDHGAQFRMVDEESSAFRVYLWACGVVHTQGRVAHPQTQGKVERLNRTLEIEVISRHDYSDPDSWQRCFDDWRYLYNNIRPHQELGDEPPISRYQNSDRPFVEPDRNECIGEPGSVYRRVSQRGWISLGGQKLMVGRGFSGWMVENRPLGNGCWHIYFRCHFIREYILTRPLDKGDVRS